MKSYLGAAMGFAAGLLAGWFLFTGEGAPPAREVVRTVYVPDDPESGRLDGADEPGGGEPGAGAFDPRPVAGEARLVTSDDLRGASREELLRILANREARIDPGAVAELTRQLDEARAQRDWNLFRTLLSLLGKANTPEAQGKLVAVMADAELGFHRTRLGGRFFEWLRGSDAPGIVEAARVRLEREMKDNPGSTTAQRGWLALIAEHGGAGDLDWIESRATSRAGRREVIDAFVAASGRPEVAERVARLFREREQRWFSGHLRTLARNNPAVAMQLMEEGMSKPKRGEERDLARVYGEAVRGDDVERARGFLLGLNDPAQRLGAVYAVEQMKRRGLDVSGLESVVLAPTEALERFAQDPKATGLLEARYAVERNPITWSERTAKALETAAEHAPKSQVASLRNAARKVRAGIGSPESEWVTR